MRFGNQIVICRAAHEPLSAVSTFGVFEPLYGLFVCPLRMSSLFREQKRQPPVRECTAGLPQNPLWKHEFPTAMVQDNIGSGW